MKSHSYAQSSPPGRPYTITNSPPSYRSLATYPAPLDSGCVAGIPTNMASISAQVSHQGISYKEENSRGLLRCYGPRYIQKTIPFHDILRAECVSPSTTTWDVSYVKRTAKPYRLVTQRFRLQSSPDEDAGIPIDGSEPLFEMPPAKRLLVLINPRSGPGTARRDYEKYAKPVLEIAGTHLREIQTQYTREAMELVSDLSIDEWDGIVCVSGDGLPHEVINGLANREDASEALAHFAVVQLPGGSGNAMSNSLNDGDAEWANVALNIVKGSVQPVDLMGLTQGSNKFLSFLSTSFGLVADCDLGTEDWRWMGGARFTVGILIKCLAQNTYPCDVAYKLATHDSASGVQAFYEANLGKTTKMSPSSDLTLRYGTVNDALDSSWTVENHDNLSMFYVGKMPYMSGDALCFPLALPTDGAMDIFIWDTDVSRAKALRTLLKFEKGTHIDEIWYRKITAFRLTPHTSTAYLSVDGESYPCQPLQAEILPGAGRTFVAPP